MTNVPLPSPILLFYRPAFFCRFVGASEAEPACVAAEPPKNEPGGLAQKVHAELLDGKLPDTNYMAPVGGAPQRHQAAAGKIRHLAIVDANVGSPFQPRIKLWTRHPAEITYDEAGAFTINLFQTPEMYLQGMVDRVAVDDHTHNSGYTTIGPAFPHAYGAGGIYVCEQVLNDAIYRDQDACENNHIPLDMHRDPLVDDAVIVAFKRNPADDSSQPILPVRYHGFYGQKLFTASNGAMWIVWHPGTWKSIDVTDPSSSTYLHGAQWHPPRKLWIPDTVKPTPAETPDLTVLRDDEDPANPIFLEQSYALYTAELTVPKQPSGSSEDGAVVSMTLFANNAPKRPRIAPAVAMPPPAREGRNLNVISAYAPGEINRIKQKLIDTGTPFLSVEEGETLVDALTAYVSRVRSPPVRNHETYPPFENLDLIGHSRTRDHVLKIGELTMTSAVAREQFTALYDRGVLDALGIKAVRLLGCRTAAPPRGIKVVRAISEATELTVYATRGDLFAVHYDQGGLRPEAELLLADDDVLLKSGAGDMPPNDDYLPALPDDDPDDPADGQPPASPVRPPERFSLAALSDANASKMSACAYRWWPWNADHFADLVNLVRVDSCREDNPLLRAEYEVLLSVSTTVRDTSDLRSFDLFLSDQPRIRVNRGGKSFAFSFRSDTPLPKALIDLGIAVDPTGKSPC
jgi:hypothetical protein